MGDQHPEDIVPRVAIRCLSRGRHSVIYLINILYFAAAQELPNCDLRGITIRASSFEVRLRVARETRL